jgi:sugar lactone lactonase YvrE
VPLWGFGGVQAQSDQQRHQVTADVMAEQAAAHPGKVTVVDLLGWLTTAGLVDDHAARPDGVHWTTEVATRIATEFLGERLVRAALAS